MTRSGPGAIPCNPRDPEFVVRCLDGLDVVPPGVIPIRRWRPDPATESSADVNTDGGIGRKK